MVNLDITSGKGLSEPHPLREHSAAVGISKPPNFKKRKSGARNDFVLGCLVLDAQPEKLSFLRCFSPFEMTYKNCSIKIEINEIKNGETIAPRNPARLPRLKGQTGNFEATV